MDVAALLPRLEWFLWVTAVSWKVHRDMSVLWKNSGGLISVVWPPSGSGEEERRYLTCCFSVREGALTFFFWFALQIPESRQKEVTAERVNTMLHQELSTSFNNSGSLPYQMEYRVNPDSLVLLGKYRLLSWAVRNAPRFIRCWREVSRKGQKSPLKGIGETWRG